MKTQKADLNSPDKNFVAGLINTTINSRIVIIGLIMIVIMCIGLLFSMINQPKIITMIDKQTGETYASVSSAMNKDILERQIMFYSKRFIENYFSLDGNRVIHKRSEALAMMHSELKRKSGGENFIKTKEVAEAIENKYSEKYDWQRMPVITKRNHPHYSVFMQFQREITKSGYKPIITKHNVKIDWRYDTGLNPYEKPHNLIVMDVTALDEQSSEYKTQINLSY